MPLIRVLYLIHAKFLLVLKAFYGRLFKAALIEAPLSLTIDGKWKADVSSLEEIESDEDELREMNARIASDVDLRLLAQQNEDVQQIGTATIMTKLTMQEQRRSSDDHQRPGKGSHQSTGMQIPFCRMVEARRCLHLDEAQCKKPLPTESD